MAVDDEELFAYLLLMHGPDPEPSRRTTTSVYRKWVKEVEITINEQGRYWDIFDDYCQWLAKNGLHHNMTGD